MEPLFSSLGGHPGLQEHRVRVRLSAVEADLAVIALQGADVPHLDHTEGKLKEELSRIGRKIRHKRLVHPGSGLQRLVAGQQALAFADVLVVVRVEFVGRHEIQIRQRERQVAWRPRRRVLRPRRTHRRVQEVAEARVDIRVTDGEPPHNRALDSPNRVRTCTAHIWLRHCQSTKLS